MPRNDGGGWCGYAEFATSAHQREAELSDRKQDKAKTPRRLGVREFRGNMAGFLRQERAGRSFLTKSRDEVLAELRPPAISTRPDRQPGALRGRLAELNALHPFRAGNGRTQAIFLALLADQAGHPVALERIEPERFLAAMIANFDGDEGLLADQIRKLKR